MLHLLLLVGTAALGQQSLPVSLAPAGTELNQDSPALLMGPGCRIQQFYELSEIGAAPAGTIQLTAVSLRFDGPTGGEAATTQTIDSLILRVGATHRSVDQVGAVFDRNLTLPLLSAFAALDFAFVTDGTVTSGPEPWGGPDGHLRLAFGAPVQVAVPAGGSLVFELIARGNSNGGGAHPARLDFYVEAAAIANPGTSLASGIGCVPPSLVLDTRGQYEPGTAFTVLGLGHEPLTPAVTLLTAKLLPTIWLLPWASGCWLYLDLSTGGVASVLMADPTGTTVGEIPLPRAPELCGARIYIQNVGFAPGSLPARLATSNYRTIEIGCTRTPITRGWHAAHPADPDARVASVSVAGGFAMRIE